LIVPHVDLGNAPRHIGADFHARRLHIGVVRRYVAAAGQIDDERDNREQRRPRDQQESSMSADPVLMCDGSGSLRHEGFLSGAGINAGRSGETLGVKSLAAGAVSA